MATGILKATFARGGSSNGLVVLRSELPEDVQKWQPILAAAMGSPDPNYRQLNGMGGGISSTSKVCVIEASKRPNIDIDYTFVQVGIEKGDLDLSGNCGNMSSVVGPVALEDGLFDERSISQSVEGDTVATVRILNTNTNKLIHATFRVKKAGNKWLFDPTGDYTMAAVPGSGCRITLCFIDPAGAQIGKALPTGNAVDILHLPEADGGPIEASLVDVASFVIYVRASDLGIDGGIKSDALQAHTNMMQRLEKIRRAGAERMGLDPNVQGLPKIVIVSPASETTAGADIQVRALSMGQAHKAIPVTVALNVGPACGIGGTLPAQMVPSSASKDSITISHPAGLIEVGSKFTEDGKIESALLHRTAKVLMKGEVYY